MNGVIILSLRKPAYSIAAFNLALSIKYHNPNIHITLVSDGEHQKHFNAYHYSVFDYIKQIAVCDFIDKDGSFQPALAKLSLHKYSSYDGSLYIDADSLCLKDLQPLFDKLKGSKFKSNVIPGYTNWTDEETFKSFFGANFATTINTSWFYWEEKSVFDQANRDYERNFPLDKVSPKWGGTYPDELFFNAAITKTSTDPKVNFEVMFFGNNIDPRTFDEIEADYFAFTLYGNRTTVRLIYQTWYDKLMFKMCEKHGIEHRFKANRILEGKHVSGK